MGKQIISKEKYPTGQDVENALDAGVSALAKATDLELEVGGDAKTLNVENYSYINAYWNVSKFTYSANWRTYIIPLKDGVRYSNFKVPGVSFVRLCSDIPTIDGTGGTNIQKPAGDVTGSASYAYMALCFMNSNYVNIPSCQLVENEYGMFKDIKDLQIDVSDCKSRVSQCEKSIDTIGSNKVTKYVKDCEMINAYWDNSKFAGATNWKTYIIPLKDNVKYSDFSNGAYAIRVCSEKPEINGIGGINIKKPKEPVIGSPTNKYIAVVFMGTTDVSHFTYVEGAFGLYVENYPLSLKNIVVFGDSIVEGVNVQTGEKSLCNVIADVSGAYVVRGGIGGTQLGARADISRTLKTAKEAYANVDIPNLVYAWANDDWSTVDPAIDWLKTNVKDDNTSIINDLKAISINNVDIVIIAGGTNDLNASTFGDHNSDDQRTLRGGIKYIISSLLAVKPTLSIYFFTPLPRITATLQDPDTPVYSDNYRAGQECSFLNLVDAVLEECKSNHIPCGDVYHNLGINEYNIKSYGGGVAGDDYTHITKAYPRYARFIYQFLLSTSIWG